MVFLPALCQECQRALIWESNTALFSSWWSEPEDSPGNWETHAGQNCGSQQSHTLLREKSAKGLELDQGLQKSPGTTCSQNVGEIC